MNNLEQIAAFVREHSMECHVSQSEGVAIEVPFTNPHGNVQTAYLSAHTMDEAREILGY